MGPHVWAQLCGDAHLLNFGMFDTPERIKAMVPRIQVLAIQNRTMPFLNKTGMTDEERAKLGAWIESGAKLP